MSFRYDFQICEKKCIQRIPHRKKRSREAHGSKSSNLWSQATIFTWLRPINNISSWQITIVFFLSYTVRSWIIPAFLASSTSWGRVKKCSTTCRQFFITMQSGLFITRIISLMNNKVRVRRNTHGIPLHTTPRTLLEQMLIYRRNPYFHAKFVAKILVLLTRSRCGNFKSQLVITGAFQVELLWTILTIGPSKHFKALNGHLQGKSFRFPLNI